MKMLKHASVEVSHAGYLEASDCIDWAIKRIGDLEAENEKLKRELPECASCGSTYWVRDGDPAEYGCPYCEKAELGRQLVAADEITNNLMEAGKELGVEIAELKCQLAEAWAAREPLEQALRDIAYPPDAPEGTAKKPWQIALDVLGIPYYEAEPEVETPNPARSGF